MRVHRHRHVDGCNAGEFIGRDESREEIHIPIA
jgi:hypothetical protein